MSIAQVVFANELYKSQEEILGMSGTSETMLMRELIQEFKDKWVLVEVLEDECDEPRKVRIIAASKSRDEIYKKQKEIKGDIAIFYTWEIPKGYAVAFNG